MGLTSKQKEQLDVLLRTYPPLSPAGTDRISLKTLRDFLLFLKDLGTVIGVELPLYLVGGAATNIVLSKELLKSGISFQSKFKVQRLIDMIADFDFKVILPNEVYDFLTEALATKNSPVLASFFLRKLDGWTFLHLQGDGACAMDVVMQLICNEGSQELPFTSFYIEITLDNFSFLELLESNETLKNDLQFGILCHIIQTLTVKKPNTEKGFFVMGDGFEHFIQNRLKGLYWKFKPLFDRTPPECRTYLVSLLSDPSRVSRLPKLIGKIKFAKSILPEGVPFIQKYYPDEGVLEKVVTDFLETILSEFSLYLSKKGYQECLDDSFETEISRFQKILDNIKVIPVDEMKTESQRFKSKMQEYRTFLDRLEKGIPASAQKGTPKLDEYGQFLKMLLNRVFLQLQFGTLSSVLCEKVFDNGPFSSLLKQVFLNYTAEFLKGNGVSVFEGLKKKVFTPVVFFQVDADVMLAFRNNLQSKLDLFLQSLPHAASKILRGKLGCAVERVCVA